MSPEEISSLLKRRPFMPFNVHVTGNVEHTIREPEMTMIGRTVLFIGGRRDIDSPYFDEPILVSMRHITRLEPIVEATAS